MNNFWKLGIGAVIAWLVLKPRTLWTTKQLTLVDLNEKGNTAGAFPTDTIYKPGDKLGTVAKGKPITLEGYNIIFIKSAKSPNICRCG